VETAPLTWFDWIRSGGAKKATIRSLLNAAREAGSDVNAWRAALGTVGPAAIVGADVWHEGAWLRAAERGEDGELLVSPEPPSPFAAFAQGEVDSTAGRRSSRPALRVSGACFQENQKQGH